MDRDMALFNVHLKFKFGSINNEPRPFKWRYYLIHTMNSVEDYAKRLAKSEKENLDTL